MHAARRRIGRTLPGALLALLVVACGGSDDAPSAVSSSPTSPLERTPPPVTPPTTADVQMVCAIDTPMRWARPWNVGYDGAALALTPPGEAGRRIVFDPARVTRTQVGNLTTFGGPSTDGLDASFSVDTAGVIVGATLVGEAPADTIRCGVARDGIPVAGAETIMLACTRTDTTTPGGPTTVPAAPLEFLADFASFPWRYLATTDATIRDDEVGRLVGGSGAVVTREPSTDNRLRYSVAIGNRGIGEDAAYYELVDGRLSSMSQGNRRVVRDCVP